MNRITSQKVLIEKMKEGWKLWYYSGPRLNHYYLYKDKQEINVSPSILIKLVEKGIIDENLQLTIN
jgi:hypothetical protein